MTAPANHDEVNQAMVDSKVEAIARVGLGRWIVLAAVAVLCAATTAFAQDSWWKKGADLFGGTSSGGGDVAAGLKEALVVGTDNVVTQLGQPGGFENDPAIRIPLPSSLATVQRGLATLGMSSMLDELELKLNEAAEVATPKAKDLFIDAIAAMTLDDAMKIYKGPDDAATRYFQSKMSRPLAEEMSPLVASSLSDVGAVEQYDAVMRQYETIPFMPDVKANLTTYVVEKGMDGIFHYLAVQEAAIRTNPAARTTELLRQVFGK